MAGALSGLKIVELGEMVSAPYAAKLMADMGAEVIKIERPGAGDPARVRGPFPGGTAASRKERPLSLPQYQQARRHARRFASRRLRIARAAGRRRRRSDSQRRAARHGPYRPQLRAPARVNPRLVMTSISPWGLSGPKREWRAEDLTLWCASGICYINGGGPSIPKCRRSRPSAIRPASRAECMRRWRRWARCSRKCATARGSTSTSRSTNRWPRRWSCSSSSGPT